jgi:general secretion pathway protein B
MSYILDALKKSEQERGNGNIPGVQTVHSSSLNYNNKKTYWPYILIAAVLLNLIAIIYFVFDKENKTAVEPVVTADQTTTEIISAPVKVIEQTQEENKQTAHTTATEKPITLNNVETSSEKQIAPAASREMTSNNTIVEYYDLAEHIKQQLPKIIISAHVYSSNPVQRSIVINNNFMEEGEYVLDDLVLYEITRDGAVFSYHETLFHRGIVNTWQ